MKICTECHAFHDGRKWTAFCLLPPKKQSKMIFTLCPGCKRMRDKVVLGRVYLEGEVVAERPEEVLRMIRHEEKIEQARNHCARIFDITNRGSKMTVNTVNSALAIRIARQLKKAFKGKMLIYKDTPGHRPRNKESEGTVAVKWTQHA